MNIFLLWLSRGENFSHNTDEGKNLIEFPKIHQISQGEPSRVISTFKVIYSNENNRSKKKSRGEKNENTIRQNPSLGERIRSSRRVSDGNLKLYCDESEWRKVRSDRGGTRS
jgi:hypothetical protein